MPELNRELIRGLDIDQNIKNYGFNFDNSYLNLPKEFYTHTQPEKTSSPELVILNHNLIKTLGLNFSNTSPKQIAEIFSGNKLLNPNHHGYFAQAYAGHQYGNFTMLGDGRAVLIGEHLSPTNQRVDIQLKGSGQTVYSRRGDGKAILGPMLREYILSEAMHALGIPTTRSLAVVKTGEFIWREQELPGAVLTRTASSHLRIGTFELARFTEKQTNISQLLDYAIERHYPELINSENNPLAFLKTVMTRQAELITHWMRIGFIHGVMNSDNMTISGETIDYGPCAFMDSYDPNTVFSSIDTMGRYAYDQQAKIAHWNLSKLAEVLLPLVDSDPQKSLSMTQEVINLFPEIYQKKYFKMMTEKLGLFELQATDQSLIQDLLSWMQNNKVDYTNTFCDLSQESLPKLPQYQTTEFITWHQQWQKRLNKQSQSDNQAIKLMQSVNPNIIPRNHQVELALTAANQNNFEPLDNLLNALKDPYNYQQEFTEKYNSYRQPPTPEQEVCQTFCGT